MNLFYKIFNNKTIRILFLFQLFIFNSQFSFADCLDYKQTPKIKIIVPEQNVSVMQSVKKMSALHGDVTATFSEKFTLNVMVYPLKSGACVVLNGVNAAIGYTDFIVQISRAHEKNSCAYNATLYHEQKHIAAYNDAARSATYDITAAVKNAATSIVPIFVENADDTDSAVDKMQNEIQNYPDIILMKQNIAADTELRNMAVDRGDNKNAIAQCIKNNQ